MVIQPQEKMGRKKGKKKICGNKPQTIKKMATGAYILIILLNANGLNALTKRHRMAEWIYAVFKKSTSDLKIHIDLEDGKIYLMQMGSKRKLE